MAEAEANDGSGDWAPIRVGRASVGAAILAAILLLCTYITHPIPRFVGRPLGVHQGDFAARGGLALTWEAPTVDQDRLRPIVAAMRARNPDGYVSYEGSTFHIALPGIPASEIDAFVDKITKSEGLTFREVLVVPEMKQLADFVPREHVDEDPWRPENGGALRTDHYLHAGTREELDQLFADARAKGWTLPPRTHIAYERIESEKHTEFRSYVVSDDVELDGTDVESAVVTYDPVTNRPIVMLEFTRDGARKFGDVTTRVAGDKLAILVDGMVRSAPVINSPIRGGRAEISMGALDAERQEREAHDLADTLKAGNLPPGGHVVEAHYVAPSANASRLWLARIVIALLGALAVFAIAFTALRFARPERRPLVAAAPGSWPWSRLAVMLVAPLALWGVQQIGLFGVNDTDLHYLLWTSVARQHLTIGSLGIMPVLTAYVAVEVFSLLLPTWRRRRNAGPIARQPITLAAAVVTILLIAFQGWSTVGYLEHFDNVLYPGMTGKVLVIASLAGGTLILILAAELIRWRGLGNGYGALLATGWIISLIHPFGENVSDPPTGARIVQLVASAVIAVGFLVALRWRVRARGELALRFPASSFAPLADAGGIVALLALASQFPIEQALYKTVDWVLHVRDHAIMLIVLVAVLTILWSLLLARPAPFAGQARPSASTWTRATVLSAAALVLVAAVAALVGSLFEQNRRFVEIRVVLVDPVMIAITVAVLLDAFEDFRARRQKLVVAWTLHEPHHADAAQQLLAADGIQAHMSASYLRSLLSFFGPFVPIEVQVPAEQAQAAREKLERLS